MAVGATVDVRNARVELGNARDHDDDDHGCGSDGATGRLSRPVRHRLRDLDEREGDLESLAVAVSPTTVTTAAKRTLGPFPALGELTVDDATESVIAADPNGSNPSPDTIDAGFARLSLFSIGRCLGGNNLASVVTDTVGTQLGTDTVNAFVSCDLQGQLAYTTSNGGVSVATDVSGNLSSASGSTTIKYAPPSVATFTNVKLTTIKAIELPTGFTVASIAIDETGVIYAAGSLVGINEIVASSASGAFPAAQVPIAVLPNAASQISI